MASNPNTNTLGTMAKMAIASPQGQLTSNRVVDLEFAREVVAEMRHYLNGTRYPYEFANGWSGRISFDRTDGNYEGALSKIDSAYDADGTYTNSEIVIQFTDPTGNGSYTLNFHQCALGAFRVTNIRQNGVVTCQLSFRCSTMNYTAGL